MLVAPALLGAARASFCQYSAAIRATAEWPASCSGGTRGSAGPGALRGGSDRSCRRTEKTNGLPFRTKRLKETMKLSRKSSFKARKPLKSDSERENQLLSHFFRQSRGIDAGLVS